MRRYPRRFRSRFRRRPLRNRRRRSSFRRNLDPSLLIALRRRNIDDFDMDRLTNLRRRRNFDPERLTGLRRRRFNPRRFRNNCISCGPKRHLPRCYRRRNSMSSLIPTSVQPLYRKRHSIARPRFSRYARNPGYRLNPDPNGKPWGPSLYNPLEDTKHKFKNEKHYNKMIAKLRRNPW